MKTLLFLRKLLHYLNIESEMEDHDAIHDEIRKGIVFKGTNLWILFFAILVASVGLNMNSTAVIIGAMLISPLMGPINGMGYSIATYNFDLFRQSLKNFSFAVAVSLVASTTYFAISPISTAHSELLARTSPSIYDVMIALFGGLAGIVAISSRQKGNVIPGVAIATALMPPLCTAGYGLATGQYEFFFGAFYLFTINTVFIALASVIISQVFNFPIRTLVDAGRKKQVNRWITLVMIGVLLPSIYFGYGLVQNERFVENANRYISNVSSFEGNYLLKHEVDPNQRTITLVYGGVTLGSGQKSEIIEKAGQFNLTDVAIDIRQGFALTGVDEKVLEISRLKEELLHAKNSAHQMEARCDSLVARPQTGQMLLNEIHPLYPAIVGCTFAESVLYRKDKEGEKPMMLVIFEVNHQGLSALERDKVKKWLQSRLQNERLRVIFD
ncbi:MAG: DUF389 domain-containing protein [Marinilabiliaceae bacterium]|nr:DUF389 domain-containing protein [Marinilabiliaceae bacterium]